MADDQGSCRGHHCNETMLTGDPSSKSVGAPPGHEPLPPLAVSKRLTYWTSETVCKLGNAGATQMYFYVTYFLLFGHQLLINPLKQHLLKTMRLFFLI
jgi:hypothetical protein